MLRTVETEPEVPTRNVVERFFVDTLRYPDLGYAIGAIQIAAIAAVGGGAYETLVEGNRVAVMLGEHNYAEAIRSGLAIAGAEVATVTGLGVIRSFARVWNHPNAQRLYDYHARMRSAWDRRVRHQERY